MEPPANALIAAYVGYKSPKEEKASPTTQAEESFFSTVGTGRAKSFDNLPLKVQSFFKNLSANPEII